MLQNILKKFGLGCQVLIRIDDIAPNMKWDYFFRAKKIFDKYNIKPIIGVIPKNEDKDLKQYPKCSFDFWQEIRNLQNQGWEIAMHGYEHIYDSSCKNDYLRHSGKTEFAGHEYKIQFERIQKGVEIFKQNGINLKSFFAPNHTFDVNTILACKNLGIQTIVDGYGIRPYDENGIIFIPQLFYSLFLLPFGFQTIQIHLNYFDEKNYLNFENFLIKNHNKFIIFSKASELVNYNIFYKILKFLTKYILIFKRKKPT